MFLSGDLKMEVNHLKDIELHGDHHDLWIDPEDNSRLIVGDDGGAQVSNDGALSWSTYMNQPTAQYYQSLLTIAFHIIF